MLNKNVKHKVLESAVYYTSHLHGAAFVSTTKQH